MQARLISVMAESHGPQQKDNLCGPFWAARVLNESGYATWDGQPIDEDLIAQRAGTMLPNAGTNAGVPPGAVSRAAYRYALSTAPVAESGTSVQALGGAVGARGGD